MEVNDLAHIAAQEEQLAAVRARPAEIGIGPLAVELGMDPSNLAKVFRGKRSVEALLRRLG
jgi:hypothetical protein